MDQLLNPIAFSIGMILQIFFMFNGVKFNKKDKEELRILGFLSIFMFFIVFGGYFLEGDPNFPAAIISTVYIIGFLFIVTFYKKIAVTVNELTLLFWFMLLGYIYVSYMGFEFWKFPEGKMFLAFLGTIILLNFVHLRYSKAFRFIFYLLYTVLVVVIAIHQFWVLEFFRADAVNPLDVLLAGISFAYLFPHVVTFMGLADKNFNSMVEHVKTVVLKFSNNQTKLRSVLLMIFLVGGMMIANLYYKVIDHRTFISLMIIFVPQTADAVRKGFLAGVGSKL